LADELKLATLGCQALILDHGAWAVEHTQHVRQARLWALAYTVNETADALITDRIDLFRPDR
jgi:hypothetical protein